jgi:hypothetical protein
LDSPLASFSFEKQTGKYVSHSLALARLLTIACNMKNCLHFFESTHSPSPGANYFTRTIPLPVIPLQFSLFPAFAVDIIKTFFKN